MKTLRYYDTVFEAEVVRARLEDAGIPATVNNSMRGETPATPAFNSMRPYISVADRDVGRAIEVLGIGIRGASTGTCPACGSADLHCTLHYKNRTSKVLINLMIALSLISGVNPDDRIRREYDCRDCGARF
ncbi:DUF2007 domain-containing protein [Alistipes sp. OttesenSCG-928-B03]|nr:DUF2007 domain-containing protein [Alistipes sp. OttesenSCG-928-B03]